MSARDINITSRQSTAHARQLAARAARRPLDLPRLLRPRPLGLRALEPGRHQADRGGARSGLGGVGRQRPDRRRQHHHQDAARGAQGINLTLHRRASSTATRARAQARAAGTLYGAQLQLSRARPTTSWSYRLAAGYFNSDPLPRPVGHASPSSRDPAGQPGARPIGGGDLPATFENQGTSQPKVDARRPGAAQRRPHHLQRRLRGHRGHRPHRHRPLRPRRAARTSATAASATAKGALQASRAFANLARRRGAEPADRGPRTGSPVAAQLQDPDLRPRGRPLARARRQAHPDLRRQRAPQQLRHHHRAQRRGPHRVRRLLPGRDLLRQVPLRPWAAAWTSSATSTTRSSRRA